MNLDYKEIRKCQNPSAYKNDNKEDGGIRWIEGISDNILEGCF